MSKKSDKKIIEEVLNGNTNEFAHLIERYQEKVLRYTYHHIGPYDDAEDAAQDIFVAVLESLHKFRGESEFSTWLYSITANYCKNYKKKRYLKDISLVKTGDSSENNDEYIIHDERQNTEEQVILDESLSIVKEEIVKLSDQYKEVLILRDIEGLSYEEIAASLEISLSNVKVRIHRGREMLMRRLSKRGIL